MLSVVDLLEAGTLDLDVAAFLMARISRGASFMVGARPGGAGKTTVMCALLNLVPPGCELIAATPAAVRAAAHDGSPKQQCLVCHEIGAGPYFSYLWGADLRAYCALSEKDRTLATNLHADDLDEARTQVCVENGVPAEHFNAFHVALFLRVRGGFTKERRWIEKVYVADDKGPHLLAFDKRGGTRFAATEDPAYLEQCRAFLKNALETDVRTIEATRAEVVRFLEAEGPAVGHSR